MSTSYLVHAGTKGQKWGVRHWQHKDGSFTEEGKYRYGRKKRPGEDISELSDQELRDKLNRARMEQEYKRLTAKPESDTRKLVKKIVSSAVTAVGVKLVSDHLRNGSTVGGELVKRVMADYASGKIARNIATVAKRRKLFGNSIKIFR